MGRVDLLNCGVVWPFIRGEEDEALAEARGVPLVGVTRGRVVDG